MTRVLALSVLLLAVPAQAQIVVKLLPAHCDLHGHLEAATSEQYVMVGVPGELMHVDLHAKSPASAAGWAIDVLRPDAATQTLLPGPGGTIHVPQVQFDATGAVALQLRSLDGSGGDFLLRARSQLPVGYKHPPVHIVPGERALWKVGTWLRPGLELRTRVGLPHDATSWPQEAHPHLILTPPELVHAPISVGQAVPGGSAGAYPDVVKFVAYVGGFSHADFDIAVGPVEVLGARVKRHKLVFGKPPKGPPTAAPPPAPPMVVGLDIDQHELLPGGTAHLTVTIKPKFSPDCPAPTATARVWLSSVHGIQLGGSGALVAGPFDVPLALGEVSFETDLQVPQDIAPGLWGAWVLLGEPGGSTSPCDNLLAGASGETVVKVLAP
jgi:hypothetical protein